MDKDVYGVHLRQHLASERRKTTGTTTPNPAIPITSEHHTNKASAK